MEPERAAHSPDVGLRLLSLSCWCKCIFILKTFDNFLGPIPACMCVRWPIVNVFITSVKLIFSPENILSLASSTPLDLACEHKKRKLCVSAATWGLLQQSVSSLILPLCSLSCEGRVSTYHCSRNPTLSSLRWSERKCDFSFKIKVLQPSCFIVSLSNSVKVKCLKTLEPKTSAAHQHLHWHAAELQSPDW